MEPGYIEAGTVLFVEFLDRVLLQNIDTAGKQLRKIHRAGVEVVSFVDNE